MRSVKIVRYWVDVPSCLSLLFSACDAEWADWPQTSQQNLSIHDEHILAELISKLTVSVFSQKGQLLGLHSWTLRVLGFAASVRSFYNASAQRSLCLSALFVHACMEERRNRENGGEPVKVCRRVVGASVGLWMSPVNCVCVCVCVPGIVVGSWGVRNCWQRMLLFLLEHLQVGLWMVLAAWNGVSTIAS